MPKNDNSNFALSLVAIVVGMILLAYASVPIYNVFCKVTGYGGTTQRAKKTFSQLGTRRIKVTFDSNTGKELPWLFKPEQKEVSVITGENTLIFYSAENLTAEPIVGTAVYNVTPHKAGIYFNKIQCFCFEEQLLQGKQRVMMPVSFFIDPDIEKDPNLADVSEITLSYSFYKVIH